MATVRQTLIGGAKVTEEEVRDTPTPPATRTHNPLPHGEFLDMLYKTLKHWGWNVGQERFSLEGGKVDVEGEDVMFDTARLFGVMNIDRDDVATGEDYNLSIGLRNSHDKSMSAGIIGGIVVMVCTNMDFMGDFATGHMHTTNIKSVLPDRLNRLAGEIEEAHTDHQKVIESYKATDLSDTVAHDFLVKMCDTGVMPWSYAPKVLGEYRSPRHEEFEQRTLWGFNNATTEILKDRNIRDLPTSMAKFHQLGKELAFESGSWVDPDQLEIRA